MSGLAGLDLATSSMAPPSAPFFETQYYDEDDEYDELFEEEISLNGEEMTYYNICQLSTIAEESLSDLHSSIPSLVTSCPSLNSFSHSFDRSGDSYESTPLLKSEGKLSLHSSTMSAKQQQQQVGDNTAAIFLEVGDETKMVVSSPQQKDQKLSLENFLDFARQEEKKKRDPLEMKKESNHISLYSTMTGEEVLLPQDDDEYTFVSCSSDGSGFQVSIASEGTGDFSELSLSGKEVLEAETRRQDPQGRAANQETGPDVAAAKLEQPSKNSLKEHSATDPSGDLTNNKNNPRFVSARRKLSYEISRKRLKKSFERNGRQLSPVKEVNKMVDPLRRKKNFDLSRIKLNENFKKKIYPKGLDTQEQSKSERVEHFGGLQRKKSYALSRKMFEDNVQKSQLVRMLVNKSQDLSSLTPEQERQHTLAATYDRSRRRVRYDVSRCQLQSQLNSHVEGILS
jgi:hypothetical protein